jgi:hypothetical protein
MGKNEVAVARRPDMEHDDDTVPLPSRGRFVPPPDAMPPPVRAGRSSRRARRRGEQLAVLSLAILAGVIGFALWIFWVLALILMGSLWGMFVMEREHRPGTDKGVLAEMVDVVVDEAKDFADMAQRRIGTRDESGRIGNDH